MRTGWTVATEEDGSGATSVVELRLGCEWALPMWYQSRMASVTLPLVVARARRAHRTKHGQRCRAPPTDRLPSKHSLSASKVTDSKSSRLLALALERELGLLSLGALQVEARGALGFKPAVEPDPESFGKKATFRC